MRWVLALIISSSVWGLQGRTIDGTYVAPDRSFAVTIPEGQIKIAEVTDETRTAVLFDGGWRPGGGLYGVSWEKLASPCFSYDDFVASAEKHFVKLIGSRGEVERTQVGGKPAVTCIAKEKEKQICMTCILIDVETTAVATHRQETPVESDSSNFETFLGSLQWEELPTESLAQALI